MNMNTRKAFTIIELLVVVAIIALLIGILLPAVGKARDQAKYTTSSANLRNLAIAHAAYAAAFQDRQLTLVNDNISSWGVNARNAFDAYNAGTNKHPNVVLGWGPSDSNPNENILWQYHLDGVVPGHIWSGSPINFTWGFGHFRLAHQTQAFSPFLNGRYYDPTFFAPKDAFLYPLVEDGFDSPAEFASIRADDGTEGSVLYTSSYTMSPAAMYAPEAFRYNPQTQLAYKDPWGLDAGLRCPSMSQAAYPELKSHMIEHHWLQNTRTSCNPGFSSPGTYGGCEPYYFNHGWMSAPQTLFFDGHVATLGVREAEQADARHIAQAGYGLWTRDTPFGQNGFFINYAYDLANTSFHILTTDGIRGRDTFGK